MCGRFTLTRNYEEIIDYFQLEFFPDEYDVSYNIAPSQPVLTAVHSNQGRRAGHMKWGLVPSWVKDPKKWKPLINARSESLHEKVSFKNLVNRRRCIILADSFYEWSIKDGNKTPYRIMLKDERPFAFAALWDRNELGDNEQITCTIVTTEANEVMREVHDRMPVILENDEIEVWLNMKEYPYLEAKELLKPLDNNKLKMYPVSTLVNSPKNNSKELILPVS